MDITWTYDNRISIDPPRRPKKITGTRFASILGLNKWKTPFATWCEITRTYEEPFEETIYTAAGKIIEPKQAEYIKRVYGINIVSPTDVYGADYFKKTHGDFFPEIKITGGMWDYLEKDGDETTAVFEMKTTKRAEDWSSEIPEYYAMQAALYAWMLGVDQVYMVCSFLADSDYEHPELYTPCSSNTIVVPFRVSERYPNMTELVITANEWWKTHVEAGISPEYDEKADAKILSELRTHTLSPVTDIMDLFARADTLKSEIDRVKSQIVDKETELRSILAVIKDYMLHHIKDGDDRLVIATKNSQWTLAKSTRIDIDREAMEADGILEKYNTVQSVSYKLTQKEISK